MIQNRITFYPGFRFLKIVNLILFHDTLNEDFWFFISIFIIIIIIFIITIIIIVITTIIIIIMGLSRRNQPLEMCWRCIPETLRNLKNETFNIPTSRKPMIRRYL